MADVACVGILVTDVIVNNVDALPERGKLGAVNCVKMYSGGNAMNASINITKLGGKTSVIGKVGNDGFGTFLTDEMDKFNVDSRGFVIDSNAITSSSVVLVDSGGERTFLHCSDSNDRLSESDINFDIIAESNIVFLTGTFLMRTLDGIQTANVLKKCQEMGKITVLDTAWDAHNRWMSLIKPCLQYIDYFIPSIDEAAKIAGTEDVDAIADTFFDLGVKHVVIKLGSKGSYVRKTKADEGIVIPSYKIENPVDTTGAGDSFCSGFLFGLSRGMDIVESARFGNAVGAHCVMATGASTGIKPYEEIKKFMEEYKR